MKRILALAACLALSSGCDNILGNDDGSFTFDSGEIQFTAGMTDAVEIQPTFGGVLMEGVIVLPSPCYRLEGEQDRSSGNIIFTVTAIPTNTACPAVLSARSYHVQSLGVSRGFYRVRVRHKVGDENPRIIAEQNVQVG